MTRPYSESPNIAAILPQRVVIGVGDVGVSNNSAITLSTYGLGSCIALAAYDPLAKCGGLLHVMLPESALSLEKAAAQPALFVDTGVPLFLRALAGVRAELNRLRIFVAGGASVLSTPDAFHIGERNTHAALDLLAQAGLAASHIDVGGTLNRTVHLNIGTGTVTLKTPLAIESWALGV